MTRQNTGLGKHTRTFFKGVHVLFMTYRSRTMCKTPKNMMNIDQKQHHIKISNSKQKRQLANMEMKKKVL